MNFLQIVFQMHYIGLKENHRFDNFFKGSLLVNYQSRGYHWYSSHYLGMAITNFLENSFLNYGGETMIKTLHVLVLI